MLLGKCYRNAVGIIHCAVNDETPVWNRQHDSVGSQSSEAGMGTSLYPSVQGRMCHYVAVLLWDSVWLL